MSLSSIDSESHRGMVNAYPTFLAGGYQKLVKYVPILVGLLIFRNIFLHDYRADQVNTLLSYGKSMDEVYNLVPPTVKERRKMLKEQENDFKQVKAELLLLKQEIASLVQRLDEADKSNANEGIKPMIEDEGQSLEKIRFQEEAKSEIDELKRISQGKTQSESMHPNLSERGEIAEGDLLSG